MWAQVYLLLLSLIPAALFLGLIRSRVPVHSTTEPFFAGLAFAGGVIVAPITFFIFEGLSLIHGLEALNNPMAYPDYERIILSFTLIAPFEEMFKFWPVVLISLYRAGQFRPVDAVACAGASGLGFAAMENWYAMYSIGGPDYGRVLVIPFIHMLLTGVVGSGMAVYLARKKGITALVWSLAAAILLHGLYDTVELVGGWIHFILLPVVAVLYYRLSTDLNRMGRLSIPRDKSDLGGVRK